MKSIVCTYPDFRTLPKGLKQMLVLSETLFFEEALTAPEKTGNSMTLDKHLWLPPQKQLARNGYAAFAA